MSVSTGTPMANELAQDEILLQEFITESDEQLQRMEQDLLSLETSVADADLLNRIFRAMHTIKGTSSFLGFDVVVEITHEAEDLLNLMRRGECRPTKAITDVMLRVCDQVRRMLCDIRDHREMQYDNSPLISELRAVRNQDATPKLGELLTAQPVIHPVELEEALRQAQQSGTKLGTVLVDRGLATPAQVEQALQRQGVTSAADNTTMRVDVRKLDLLINLVGELVLERNRLSQLSREVTLGRIDQVSLETAMSVSTARLSFITEELQTASLNTRMVQIDAVFRRLPRMIRELSTSLEKKVELVVVGQETEIDKTMVEQISDPLVHLVRNAVDHGIESPEQRLARGKPATGRLTIEARQEGDQIVVCISDDGGGIDSDKVMRKAIEKGLVSPERARQMTRREILDLIFLPGMSTAERVNNISGRGVGMDVVRSNIKKLNGTVEIDSTVGTGTTVRLRVPLTMAILPVLLVAVAEEIYAIPLRSVVETLRIRPSQIHCIEGREVLCLKDRSIPLLRLGGLFDIPGADHGRDLHRAVVLSIGESRIALLVDQLIGQESTVIKSLGDFLHDCPTIAGATISGDGRVRLVLDPAALLGAAAHSSAEALA